MSVTDHAAPRQRSIALVERLIDAGRRRDIGAIASLYADDALATSPVFGEVRGREAIARTWATIFSTFSDVFVAVRDTLVDGDRVAVLSTIETTDRAGWFGRPATGGTIAYRLVLLFTIRDGLIVRDERIYDSAGVLERLEKARLDKELRTAADVQRTLLSRTAHRGPYFDSVGDSVPCRAIGGDFFELFDLPGGEAGVLIGDVSGKGPAAALLAAMLQGMFAVEAPAGRGPADTVARINERLTARRLESRFATLVYATLSPDGRLTYANAGHNPPMLATGDAIRRLTAGGPILGVFADARFEQETLHLHDGDTLVLFTDGVTEAQRADGEEFGEPRLMTCLSGAPSMSSAALMERIMSTVREFGGHAEPRDDITVVVSQYRSASPASPRGAASG